MSSLSTHVLDTSRGAPAVGVTVALTALAGSAAAPCTLTTDANGRIAALLVQGAPGGYRLTYDLRRYVQVQDAPSFYPLVEIEVILEPDRHHHVVLTLSPYGYFVACVPS